MLQFQQCKNGNIDAYDLELLWKIRDGVYIVFWVQIGSILSEFHSFHKFIECLPCTKEKNENTGLILKT